MVDRFRNEKSKKLKILAFLFKECNNNCDFCFQNTYKNIPNIDFFLENNEKYIDIFKKSISDSSNFDEISINLMGGELFFERKTEESLLKLLYSLPDTNNITVRLTSNLIEPSLRKIINVLDNLTNRNIKTEFFTSFDFGNIRFKTKYDLNRFYENTRKIIPILKEYKIKFGIETIRTLYMLDAYEKETEEFSFIKEMSEKVFISQNELIGNFDYALSADESTSLWKLVIEKTPHISDIKSHFFESGRNCLNITRRTIIGDTISNGCCSQKYGISSEENKNEKISNMLEHYGCLTCEYYDRCSMKCPIEQKYNLCDKKDVFKYIDDKGIKL